MSWSYHLEEVSGRRPQADTRDEQMALSFDWILSLLNYCTRGVCLLLVGSQLRDTL